jgi:hypothetical protein
MPNILQHQASRSTKMLLIGNSGTGKTGALFSLAEAGYNIRLLDLDNGADILLNLAKQSVAKGKPEPASRIIYETVTEKRKAVNGRPMIDGIPKQWTTAMNFLQHWKVADKIDSADASKVIEPGYDLGPTTTWGEKDVLVIDSLTMLSLAAMNHILAINNRLGQPPQQSDWGQAMELIEQMLGLLYSTAIKCNVIVIAHITYVESEIPGGQTRGFPNTLGQKLPPKVAMYFNSTVLAATRGQGAGTKRLLITRPDGVIDVKNPAPLNMPGELPIETGLAEFFRVVRGAAPAPVATGKAS